jgi:hypothetical protein
MWRKRSIKHRYWNVLRRIRLFPGVAFIARNAAEKGFHAGLALT